jgi:hypothetical protein
MTPNQDTKNTFYQAQFAPVQGLPKSSQYGGNYRNSTVENDSEEYSYKPPKNIEQY